MKTLPLVGSLALAAALLVGCGDDGPPKVDPSEGGRLVVREVHRPAPHGETYIEGAIQFVELVVPGERKPAAKFKLNRAPVTRTVKPGAYRVVSYTRSCGGACSTRLDDPVDHCASSLSIKPGERRALQVVTVVGRRCVIEAR